MPSAFERWSFFYAFDVEAYWIMDAFLKGQVMNATTLYTQLENKSLPLIEAYHDDLVKHDKRWMDENPDVPFLHFTRKCGTHITGLFSADTYPDNGKQSPLVFGDGTRSDHLDATMCFVKHYERPTTDAPDLILYCTKSGCAKITLGQARTIIEEYQLRIRRQWRMNN